MLERFIVRHYIYHSITIADSLNFTDQFAFRPSGSTSAAIISILQCVTAMLETNQFVLMYALDFSKAFDCVRHQTLMEKIATLDIPDNIFNWIVEFFCNRLHSTRHNNTSSATASINASVIQESALGPAAFIVNAADMQPLFKQNRLFKYADDTYLLVPGEHAATSTKELANIETWANANNLRLNKAKSLEIKFTDPNKRSRVPVAASPLPLPGIPRVDSLKILGVTLSSKLSMISHVDQTIAGCAQTLFALKTLRAHGMNNNALQTVFKSVAIAKLQYASTAWRSFASSQDIARCEGFMRKSARFGFYDKNAPSFASICADSDKRFFRNIKHNPNHVLYSSLPIKTTEHYNLRQRPHDFVLPKRTSSLNDRNFVMRMLYNK